MVRYFIGPKPNKRRQKEAHIEAKEFQFFVEDFEYQSHHRYCYGVRFDPASVGLSVIFRKVPPLPVANSLRKPRAAAQNQEIFKKVAFCAASRNFQTPRHPNSTVTELWLQRAIGQDFSKFVTMKFGGRSGERKCYENVALCAVCCSSLGTDTRNLAHYDVRDRVLLI